VCPIGSEREGGFVVVVVVVVCGQFNWYRSILGGLQGRAHEDVVKKPKTRG